MIKVNLVGNPNTGKTTLYNALTHSHEHVGNWHGVTVEERVKEYEFAGDTISLVDLPGIYSLSSLSYEEGVAIDYILKEPDSLIINICDESNLQRNLYLTLCLMELGANVILAVNKIEKQPPRKIDYAKLSDLLGLPVVHIDAQKGEGLEKLNNEILKYKNHAKYNLPYLKKLKLNEISLGTSKKNDFFKIKLLEGDERAIEKLNLKENIVKPDIDAVADARYDYIEQIMSACASKTSKVYGQSKLDKIFMNRFLALPIFICILALVFYLTFFSLGAWLSNCLSLLLEKCFAGPVISLFTKLFGAQSWVTGLAEVALVGGVGSLLGFLPQVVLLFLFLSILEDSGYLARVAFAIEDILGKVGLSGKSVYTLLMGFGCSTTAVLTARNMEDKNSKIKTALLTPYMSCSAKFPIYAVLGGAFFGANNIFVILGLYLLGVVVAVTLSYIFEKTVLKSKQQSFILEFPPYHGLSAKRVFSVLWENVKSFLTRVGTLLVSMNVIVWLLSNFSFSLKYVAFMDQPSMLETLGKLLAPIFIPLGFGNWALVSALIAGLVAKEVVLSSIAMFNGVSDTNQIAKSLFDPASVVFFASGASVLSYLVFCLLYSPCLATTSVLSKEIGKKWTFIGILIEFVSAYVVAFVTYRLALAVENFGAIKVMLVGAAIVIILAAFFTVIKKIKMRRLCPQCDRCQARCPKRKK